MPEEATTEEAGTALAGEGDPTPAPEGNPAPGTALTGDGDPAPAPAGEPAKDDAAKDDAGKGEGEPAPIDADAFTLPEGMQLDPMAMETFLPLAKELNLNQEQAQKLVDIFADGAQRYEQQGQEAFQTLKREWNAAAQADKEIGGEHYIESVTFGKQALRKLGTPELKAALETTGLGDNPEVIRFFSRVGRILAEDNIDAGRVLGGVPKDAASVMFPNQN